MRRLWPFAAAFVCWAAAPLRAELLFDFNASWRYVKGFEEASSPDPTAWRASGFDDRTWASGAAPFFYGETLDGTSLPDMRGAYTCVFLRRTFVIDNPADVAALRLQALSDDGFVAWINGQPVIRFNVPDGEIPFDGTALGTFPEPLPTESYDIAGFRDLLVRGTNVIAVQGFNASISASSDFVFAATLEAEVDDRAPTVQSVLPDAGARVRDLRSVEVFFSEMVSGVEATDLRVNGVATTNVIELAGDQYLFQFAQPAQGGVKFTWAADAGIRDLSSRSNAFSGGTWTCTLDPNAPEPGLTISEFLADNDRTLNDEDGDASDWIEIENTTDRAVNLNGWFLTDTATDLTQWRF